MLHNLGFLISTRKSTLDPTSTLEFLGVLVDSEKMTLSLLQEKVEKIKTQCKELSKLIGWLSSTAVATFPAPLPYRTLIHQKIQEMISKSSLYLQLSLSKQAREELHWWIQNLSFYKGKFFISPPAQLILSLDISVQGWGHNAKRKQQELHEEIPHKCAGTKSRQSGNNEFYYSKEEENFHPKFSFRMDNMIALSYLMKMRGKKGRI